MFDKWSMMTNWDLVLPPSRPNRTELQRIRALAKGVDKALAVGVLGSTPEFRDLLYELGFSDIYVLDKSKKFSDLMSARRVFDHRSEVVVTGDWLATLSQLRGVFSILLSDLTSGNIEYDDRARFYQMIRESLAPNGLFIDKVLTNESGLLTLDVIRRRYEHSPVNLQVANALSCDALFCSDLQRHSGVVNTAVMYDTLREQLTGDRWSALLDASELITPRELIWYYGVEWHALSSDYGRGLTLIDKFPLDKNLSYARRGWQFVWCRV